MIFVFAVSVPTMYEDEYTYFYRSFLCLKSQRLKNHNSSKEYKTTLMTDRCLVVVDDYFAGYMRKGGRVHVYVSVYVGVSLYDPRVHVRVLHCYLHRNLALLILYIFLRFHRFSVVVWCGIWMFYFMIITFYRHRLVFALMFQTFT